MNDRTARGTAEARRAKKSPHRDRNERPTGESRLSDEVAEDHEAQVNQLQDEPVRSSHYDDRHLHTKGRDVGQE